jgi:hypothetical protein
MSDASTPHFQTSYKRQLNAAQTPIVIYCNIFVDHDDGENIYCEMYEESQYITP